MNAILVNCNVRSHLSKLSLLLFVKDKEITKGF